MMEGEAVEIFAPSFKYFKPKVARTAPKINLYYKQIEPLRYRHSNFDELIRHQIQALIFASFHQGKEESPSAASRGKPAQRKNGPYQPKNTFPREGKSARKKHSSHLAIGTLLA
ncbi:hypothetical protein [Pedobacter sp. N23S346]|uniref:hypothetical protein n=1 Tax=Pedobacter sp. N23S346 TaxID=3402750 RepID=UPI003AD43A06